MIHRSRDRGTLKLITDSTANAGPSGWLGSVDAGLTATSANPAEASGQSEISSPTSKYRTDSSTLSNLPSSAR